jgi:indolepyruvate ferredoxin oxidoreductase
VRKRIFGYWMRFPMMLLARLQWLRESFLDPFARQEERQHEHAWRDRYIAFVETLISSPNSYNLAVAEQIAELPGEVRGFGHIKMQAMHSANQRWDELSKALSNKG